MGWGLALSLYFLSVHTAPLFPERTFVSFELGINAELVQNQNTIHLLLKNNRDTNDETRSMKANQGHFLTSCGSMPA